MFRNRMIRYYFLSLLTLTAGFFFLTSCGSGSKSPQASGTVGILLKDTHTVSVEDHAAGTTLTLTQLWITIDQISLQSSDDTWLTVFDSSAIDPATNQPVGPKVYDLLSLHSSADLIALANLPAGTYLKVRFDLDVSPGSNYFCTGSGISPCVAPDRYDLAVPSGKIDLDLHPGLVIESGTLTDVIFDMVPDKSIHIVATGNSRYILRPEIHVGLLGSAFPGGFPGEFRMDEINLEQFKGRIESAQCGASSSTLNLTLHPGEGTIDVDISQADVYSLSGTPLACEDLTPGLWVKVRGTLKSDGSVLADFVKVKSEPGKSTSGPIRCEENTGFIDHLQVTGDTATFDLLIWGGVKTLQVQVNSATKIIDEQSEDEDLSAGLQSLSNGERVSVEGEFDAETSILLATEIEIEKQE